jgi:hypothetical protein
MFVGEYLLPAWFVRGVVMATEVVKPKPTGHKPVDKVLVRIVRGEGSADIFLEGGEAVAREKLLGLLKLFPGLAVVHEMDRPVEPVYARIVPSGRTVILYVGGGTSDDKNAVLAHLARHMATFVAARDVEETHRNYSRVPGERSYYVDLQKSSGTPGQRGELVRKTLTGMPLLVSNTMPRVKLVHRENFPHEI